MLPDVRYLCKIEPKFLFGLHNAVSLCEGLHQTILDPVMHHFDEMTRAMGPDVSPAFIRRGSQSLEDGMQLLHNLRLATDHETVSLCQTPNPAACAAIYKINSHRFEP